MLVAVQSVILSLMLLSGGSDAIQREDNARLQSCIDKLDTAPDDAYEDGLAWMAESNRAQARHCTALALIELGQVEEGAARLEALANAPDGGEIAARAVYLAQAGNAWLVARRPEAAEVALTNAIKLAPRDHELLKDRARALLLLDNWSGADRDLTDALYMKAGDVEALKLRAEARLRLGSLHTAYDDVLIALELAPTDIDLLVLRGRVREAQRLAGER